MEANSFIHKVVQNCIQQIPSFENCVFVIPGKRPIVYFRKAFMEIGYEGILPEFTTIEELKEEISGFQTTKGISLWLEAFQLYRNTQPDESFETFIKWIGTTLNDFDDISIFCDNPNSVFQYLISDERIKNWDLEREEVLESTLLTQNRMYWEQMWTLYTELNATLSNQNKATQGYINRLAAQKADEYLNQNPDVHFVCIGFNALNPKEISILKSFQKHNRVTFFWDADEYYVNDYVQEAGQFLRKNWKDFHIDSKQVHWIQSNFNSDKKIDVIACSKPISQVKLAGNILENIISEQTHAENTALVLCDESLLNFVKESLPTSVQQANITMGFPLGNTHWASLVQKLIHSVHKTQNRTPTALYYADVLDIISMHQSKDSREKMQLESLKAYQKNHGIVYFTEKELHVVLKDTSLQFLAQYNASPITLLHNISEYLATYFHSEFPAFQKEMALKLSELLLSLANMLQSYPLEITFESIEILWNQVLKTETLDFIGEPLSGLQIMGILETRLLGFKNIIMLSANEGNLPLGRTENSYIPYEIKRKFNINTFTENDAIYAYHFYRLIQHAEQSYVLYNSIPDLKSSGEPSRFIQQLSRESSVTISHKNTKNASESSGFSVVEIAKNDAILEKLHAWIQNKLYPTYITSYLYNPIDFYIRHVLGIRSQDDEFEESLSRRNFGNIVHEVLCDLYKKYEKELLSEEILDQIQSRAEATLRTKISEFSHLSLFEKGYNFLQYQIMLKTIHSVIRKDKKDISEGNEIVLVQVEEKIETQIPFHESELVFAGKVDRIDSYNGILRIIDYKTADSKLSNITEKNFDKKLRNKDDAQEIQLLLYAKMAMKTYNCNEIQCGIWSLQKPLQGAKLLKMSSEILQESEVDEAINVILHIIDEILNPNIPFTQIRADLDEN